MSKNSGIIARFRHSSRESVQRYVGVIAVVSLDLIPEALVDWPTLGIAAISFLLIALLKRDVALVAAGAMLGGVIYSSIRALS